MGELHIAEKTYYRYLDRINAVMLREYIDKEPRILTEYITNSRNRRDRFQDLAVKKPEYMNSAQKIDDGIFDRLQSIGALQKAPELIKQEVVFRFKKEGEVIDTISEEVKE